MAMCPLCSERAAKRFCPAKDAQICAVCCGTKREIEIDCPAGCVYLKAARSYEAEKRTPDPELAMKVQKYDHSFLYQYGPILDAVSRQVVEERMSSQWLAGQLLDNDVIEVYKALSATMKTLSSGIYYESLPEGPIQVSLFRRLKTLIDQLMQPQQEAERRVLKVSEAIDILDFLSYAAQLNSSVRPRSRRYLDWLSEISGASAAPPVSDGQAGRLILP